MRKRLTSIDKENILKEFNGYNSKELYKKYNYVSSSTIFRFLKKNGKQFKARGKSNIGKISQYKVDLNPYKEEIINYFTKENASIEDLRKKYKTSYKNLYIFFKDNNIKLPSRSEASKKKVKKHGISSGFSNKKHNKNTKQKISESLIKQYEKGNKIPQQLKSRTFNTIYGKFLGTYEIAYFKKLLEEKKELPKKCNKGIKTPIGVYFPDFEFKDRFIEIKSEFTYNIMIGKQKGFDKKYKPRKQKEKIDWINNNCDKKIEIIIINKNDANFYFSLEVNNPVFLKDKVEIIYNQYKIKK